VKHVGDGAYEPNTFFSRNYFRAANPADLITSSLSSMEDVGHSSAALRVLMLSVP